MNATIKGIKLLAAIVVAAAATGCASVSLDKDGNGTSHDRPDNVIAQMQADSQGK